MYVSMGTGYLASESVQQRVDTASWPACLPPMLLLLLQMTMLPTRFGGVRTACSLMCFFVLLSVHAVVMTGR
jgi:hypothetical protein